MSKLGLAANLVADYISQLTFDEQNLIAEVNLAPDFDLEQITTRKIMVVPEKILSTKTRGKPEVSTRLNVAITEKINFEDAEEYLAFIEFIGEAIEKMNIPNVATVTHIEYDPVYDADVLRSSFVMISVITVTIRMLA